MADHALLPLDLQALTQAPIHQTRQALAPFLTLPEWLCPSCEEVTTDKPRIIWAVVNGQVEVTAGPMCRSCARDAEVGQCINIAPPL